MHNVIEQAASNFRVPLEIRVVYFWDSSTSWGHHDHNLVMSTSANRSGADEFQRTIGALFCIFWLMRQHLDGRECFCFGLDRDWKNAKEFLRIDGGLKIDRKGSIPTFLAKTTKGLHHHWRSRFFFFKFTLWEDPQKKHPINSTVVTVVVVLVGPFFSGANKIAEGRNVVQASTGARSRI